MSTLTTCTQEFHRLPALTLGSFLRALTIAAVAVTFGVAHLQLQFSTDRVARETNKLQTLSSKLQSENHALLGQNEALKQPDRLLAYALHEVGMVAFSPQERESIRMDRATWGRYAIARAERQDRRMKPAAGSSAAAAAAEAEQSDAEREVWLAALGEQIGLVGQAQAGQ